MEREENFTNTPRKKVNLVLLTGTPPPPRRGKAVPLQAHGVVQIDAKALWQLQKHRLSSWRPAPRAFEKRNGLTAQQMHKGGMPAGFQIEDVLLIHGQLPLFEGRVRARREKWLCRS